MAIQSADDGEEDIEQDIKELVRTLATAWVSIYTLTPSQKITKNCLKAPLCEVGLQLPSFTGQILSPNTATFAFKFFADVDKAA